MKTVSGGGALLRVWQGGGSGTHDLSAGERAGAFRRALWKFLRPHTIRGSILGASSVTARALLENQHVRAPPQPPPPPLL